MKNKFFILLFALFLVFGLVFVLRFVVGGNEDTWICENGVWVAHGMPASSPPSTGCQEKRIGGDKDEHDCLIAAGYSWCEEKGKCLREWEEPCVQEKAFEFLSGLKKDLDIEFSSIGKASFEWKLDLKEEKEDPQATEKIEGKTISAENISETKLNQIYEYFENKGFKKSLTNTSLKETNFFFGFEKKGLICLVTAFNKYDPSEEESESINPENISLRIECSEILEK